MNSKWLLIGLLGVLCNCLTPLLADDKENAFILILGVAQDAGYPQAGCYKKHCMPGWKNPELKRAATSLAVVDPSANKKYLFEATPQLPQQLYHLETEAPSSRFELAGIFLTHAHIGHYTGLMFLGHEAMSASNIKVFAMPRMLKFLSTNGPWDQLVNFKNISLVALNDQQPQNLDAIKVTPFLVPHRKEYSETVGYRIEGPNKSALFIPDINKWRDWDKDIAEQVKSVDYAFIDATFYGDGELPGRDMSKIPHPFVTESISALKTLTKEQRSKVWFIHLNHTNPLLNTDSAESKFIRSEGYHIAVEGIKLPL